MGGQPVLQVPVGIRAHAVGERTQCFPSTQQSAYSPHCGSSGVWPERSTGGKAELTRTQIVEAIAKANPPPVNLLPHEHKAIKTLQEDNCMLADKGRATVVMDRAQYDEKMNSLLDDRNTYRKLTGHPTLSIERKMNALITATAEEEGCHHR